MDSVLDFLKDLDSTEIAVGVGGLMGLIAYAVLIFVPAWTSYGRWWERVAAGFLTIYILAALVGIGVVVGVAVVWSYDRFA